MATACRSGLHYSWYNECMYMLFMFLYQPHTGLDSHAQARLLGRAAIGHLACCIPVTHDHLLDRGDCCHLQGELVLICAAHFQIRSQLTNLCRPRHESRRACKTQHYHVLCKEELKQASTWHTLRVGCKYQLRNTSCHVM